MDETPRSTNPNDHMATLQPLLEAEPPSSASSNVAPTEKLDTTSEKESKYHPQSSSLGMGQPNAGLMSGLGRSSDIPSTIDNVALSLTKWIRDRELETSPMRGKATRMVIITHVRWNYLGFPGASLLTGIVSVILCMWETQKLKNPALKDSILAALAGAPDEDLRLRLKQAAVNGKLQEIGRKGKIRWEENDEFTQLKEKRDDQPSV
ncbi:LOW QUALITY PROTEIN: uncharacterized protein FPRO_15458 [Fusarium proliferatum ET1]|uniref:Uncharacterized protein n=1 Tax=Fusarium proliferatum (strain ET1) TaxID=1227346 RepID=A0A1L7VY56_FUSPR|nr:LOW QUALITY PROTEIN: uncharacterized protein FPRO_15458 [Fusarium proliferatum ET1]CZR45367.1 uncharacterized protein FPRO_15458 [Fusarium proliferatum ET1]